MKYQGISSYIKYLGKQRHLLYLLFIFSCACAGLDAYTTIVVSKIINSLADGILVGAGNYRLLLLYISIILGSGVLNIYYGYCVSKLTYRLTEQLRDYSFSNVLEPRRTFHPAFDNGDIITRIMQDTSAVTKVIASPFNGLLREIIQGLISFVYLSMIDYRYLIIYIIICPLLYWASKDISNKSHILNKEERVISSKLTDYLGDFLDKYDIVCLYNGQKGERSLFINMNKAILEKNLHNVKNFNYYWFAIKLLQVLGGVACILIAISRITTGKVEPGEIYIVLQYSNSIFSPITGLSRYILQFNQANIAFERIFALKSKPEDIIPYPTEKKPIDEIEFDQVVYQYDNNRSIGPISFHVKRGERVILFGPSGIGKTTILKLCMGELSPQQGKIKINGVELEDYIADTINQIGYIPQMPGLFKRSIRDNIVYGSDADEKKYDTVIKASQLNSLLDEEDSALRIIENAENVSGGEAKRISLARGWIRSRDVWLLDEPTSGLDELSAKNIMQSIQEINSTSIVIISTHDTHFCTQDTCIIKLE